VLCIFFIEGEISQFNVCPLHYFPPHRLNFALSVTRLDTRLLLIDYDMSEDHNVVVKKVGKPLHGTVMMTYSNSAVTDWFYVL
jgi:hypothetical protein